MRVFTKAAQSAESGNGWEFSKKESQTFFFTPYDISSWLEVCWGKKTFSGDPYNVSFHKNLGSLHAFGGLYDVILGLKRDKGNQDYDHDDCYNLD